MKYTIKELLDKVFKIKEVYEKFHDKFSIEDIKYAIDKGEYLDWLYEYCRDKFTPELKKLYKEKISSK
jgi:hypothetical protein